MEKRGRRRGDGGGPVGGNTAKTVQKTAAVEKRGRRRGDGGGPVGKTGPRDLCLRIRFTATPKTRLRRQSRKRDGDGSGDGDGSRDGSGSRGGGGKNWAVASYLASYLATWLCNGNLGWGKTGKNGGRRRRDGGGPVGGFGANGGRRFSQFFPTLSSHYIAK